jgi:hypothetical protein
MMKSKLLLLIVVFGCLSACKSTESTNYTASNYAVAENWLHLPSDSSKAADVFYIYPVSWFRNEGEPTICPIDHPEMRATAQILLRLQAVVFDSLANVYAPFYRQLDAVTILNETDYALRNRLLDGEPTTDIEAAFDYYIRHYNKNKPFVLSGHSEGAMLVKNLLFGYLKKHPEIYKRMIAAYIIGYSITEKEILENPHVHFAQRADDVGVVISYNTEAPNLETPNPIAEEGALLINPISWTTDETTASAEQNAGSLLYIDGEYVTLPHLADATINRQRGTVICSTVDPNKYISAYGLFPLGNYHSFDYAFYFYDLRFNAAKRIERFFEQ